jgi:hypothetical protein
MLLMWVVFGASVRPFSMYMYVCMYVCVCVCQLYWDILHYIEKYLHNTVCYYSATQLTVNFPFCQQQTVWYIPINQLYNNVWLVFIPEDSGFLIVNLFSLMHRLVCLINFDLGPKRKINTVKVILNLISDKIWKYVQFCALFINPLYCELQALTVEWECLYGALRKCNWYLDISQKSI